MSTPPPPPDIVPGDVWTLIPADGLGVGIGAIPAGATVTISDLLPPFSEGVAQVDEYMVKASYDFQDWVMQPDGTSAEVPNSRTLAYAESLFRALFTPPA